MYVDNTSHQSQVDFNSGEAQMQQHLAQLNKIMMNIFVGISPSMKSPEDHMTGTAISIQHGSYKQFTSDLVDSLAVLSTPTHVALPNGSSVMVPHTGTVHFSTLLFKYLMCCLFPVFITIFSLFLNGQ